MERLVLHRANVHRKGGQWNDDDYDVTHEDVTVGRIFKASAGAPGAEPWFWSIVFHHRRPGPPVHQGYTASREDAMAAFRAAWDLQQSVGGPPDDEAAN